MATGGFNVIGFRIVHIRALLNKFSIFTRISGSIAAKNMAIRRNSNRVVPMEPFATRWVAVAPDDDHLREIVSLYAQHVAGFSGRHGAGTGSSFRVNRGDDTGIGRHKLLAEAEAGLFF